MEGKVIKQHNFLTTARYEMSALEKNIVYMLIDQLNDTDPWGKKYLVPIQELQEKRGIRIHKERALLAAKKLISRGITIYHDDQKAFVSIGVLASADYGKGNKSNHLELEFDQKLYPFLVNLKQRFTTYRLQAALDLRSRYAKRMYEILSQFKDTGVMKVSLNELKTRLGLIDVDTGKERYTEFKLFTSKVLDVAQRELAQHTEIRFSYTPRKTGKKYTNLEFKISHTPLFKGPEKDENSPVKNIDSSAKTEKYPHPDLRGDALTYYLKLTRELGWLDKKAAYKVVTSIPPHHLGNYIDKISLDVRSGKTRAPRKFFEALIARGKESAKLIELDKKIEPKNVTSDAEASMRGVCCRRLATEFSIDLFMISRISTQISPNTLLNFCDKISDETNHKDITEGSKGNFFLKRLKAEFNLLF